jgi:hypothetical protein
VNFFIIYKTKQYDQEMINKVLTSVPKHLITQIYHLFKNTRLNNNSQIDTLSQNIPVTGQSEKLIRLFNNINDESTISLDFIILIILSTLCIIFCHIIASYLLIKIYDDSLLDIEIEGQHLSSFMSSCSYQFATNVGFYSWIGTAGGAGPPAFLGDLNNQRNYERLVQRINISNTF